MYRFFDLFLATCMFIGFGCAPKGTETGDETTSNVVVGQKRNEIHLGHGTVLQIVEERENTQMLRDALRATKLDEALATGGPYTLFAPTDDAFESLDPVGINNIPDSLDTEALKEILLHHVVEGSYSAADLVGMEELPTLGGTPLKIVTANNNITVDRADLILSDQEADNGYVHMIDSVLVPS